MMRNPGDVIDDCPSCGQSQGVQFKGISDDGVSEATCVGCHEIFEIEDDEEGAAPTPAPPPAPTSSEPPAPAPAPAPAPTPAPAPVSPKLAQASSDLKKLVPVSDNKDPKAAFKLNEDGVNDFTNGGSDVPSYIRNSRAWRWAQKMGNVGNPYREGSKNHQIFAVYAEQPRTVEECVIQCAERGYNEKLSYLLTIYEVTAHCLCSGLLVIDNESRKIMPCQGKPVPAKVT